MTIGNDQHSTGLGGNRPPDVFVQRAPLQFHQALVGAAQPLAATTREDGRRYRQRQGRYTVETLIHPRIVTCREGRSYVRKFPLKNNMKEASLQGRCIAVPESRELDVFSGLLERRGATVLRCPLVDIRDAPDPAPVLAWLRAFNAGSCDDLILFTGEGLRRLLGAIERHEPTLREPFVARLAQVRKIARGPKPGRVLRDLGLKPEIVAEPATTSGVIQALQGLQLAGRRVGVQLYGSEPNLPLMETLRLAGATVLPVAPYVYADAAADAEVLDLVTELAEGHIDAIAFTSMQQVERLFRLTGQASLQTRLVEGLRRTVVAAVGPLVADTLAAHGIETQVVPGDSYYLKPLTQALVDRLGR